MQKKKTDLFYEWNDERETRFWEKTRIFDLTLQEALHAQGVKKPAMHEKLELLTLMDALQIDDVCTGSPVSSKQASEDVEQMARFVAEKGLSIRLACCARPLKDEVARAADISRNAGISMTLRLISGSEPQALVGWKNAAKFTMQNRLDEVKASVGFAVNGGMDVAFGMENTVEYHPDLVMPFYQAAMESGASRLIITDNMGVADSDTTRRWVKLFKRFKQSSGDGRISLEWSGGNKRGLAMSNVLTALEEGIDGIHATALGLGEHTGGTALEQLLVNLKLLGARDCNLSCLKDYITAAARILAYDIPINLPIVGSNAFSTATGVHAAAIIKAKKMGDDWLADTVYSSVPAGELGFEQQIGIGPMSGRANVQYLLARNQIGDEHLLEEIFQRAKTAERDLAKEDIRKIFSKYGYRMKTA